jgi:prepilin signal peptidase PulO-like enzyme (type II secretory pathway)
LLFQHIGLLAVALPLIEACFAVGAIIMALIILQTQVFPRWTGIRLLSGGMLFGLQMLLPPFVADLSVALLGLGFPTDCATRL